MRKNKRFRCILATIVCSWLCIMVFTGVCVQLLDDPDPVEYAGGRGSGDVDCIFAALFITPERQEALRFSQPTYVEEIAVMVRDTGTAARTLTAAEYSEYAELSGKKVSMLTGAPFEELVRSKVPDVGALTFFNNTPDMIQALKSGKTDAFLLNNAVAALAVSRNPELALFPQDLQTGVFGFAFAKDDPRRDDWQAACDSISEETKDIASDFEREVALKIQEQNETGASFEGLEVDHGRAVASAFAGMTPDQFNAYIQEIGVQPVLSFGNSTGDSSMAAYVTSGNPFRSLAFMLCCDDTERENGNVEKADKMFDLCGTYGWVPVSMKNDWTTIYGDDVTYLGVRSFGEDPETVAAFGAAYVNGLHEAGVI